MLKIVITSLALAAALCATVPPVHAGSGKAHLTPDTPAPVILYVEDPISVLSQNIGYWLYSNYRFGFNLSYPSSLFYVYVESHNGDGIVSHSKDGHALLRAYGSYSPIATGASLQSMFNDQVHYHGRNVTYKTINNARSFFVVSGDEMGKAFYIKTYVIDGTQKTLDIHYDVNQKGTYDKVTSQISQTFRPN